VTPYELKPDRPSRYSAGDRLIAMAAAHDAFRRDLRSLSEVATPANLRDPMRCRAIMAGYQVFKNQLLIHHRHEDDFLWPRLRDRTEGRSEAWSTLEAMEAEHSVIDPLLAAVDAAFAVPEGDNVAEATDALVESLAHHLDHEEREAMPLISEVISDAEWKLVVRDIRRHTKLSSAAEFMPWLTVATTPEETRAIAGIMPPPARVVFRRVWKPRYERVPRW
jgi:iron-sulfur cluster repair protein YtfE (RIC family)